MKKQLLKIVIVLIIGFFPFIAFSAKLPDALNKAKILNKTYRMQVPFIENKGQVEDDSISFYAKTFGGTVFVGKDGTLTYSFVSEDKGGVVIKEVLTDKRLEAKGLEPSPTRINYFKGNDQSKWKNNIPSYNSISLGEVYKGVELTLKAYGKNVEKLFRVKPGKDPGEIKVKLQGADDLQVNERGELEVVTGLDSVKFTKPIAYQEINGKRIEVLVSYHLINSQPTTHPISLSYGFKVASYDKQYPLIIDPLLASTFIGGGAIDYAQSLTLDGSGNVFVTGWAYTGFPTTTGAYDESYYDDGSADVFVSKLNSDLSFLMASTFIGGENNDIGVSIALDGSGNVYVAGQAESSGYPTTTGVYDETFNGIVDVFVSKLDSNLSTLLASTFLGGGNNDVGGSIALDGSRNVYVVGQAESGYPTTIGVYDESHNGNTDVFVSKLNSTLSTLLASTFLGGGNNDGGGSIALDGSGNVYVMGAAESGYPTTTGVYDQIYNGNTDVFVSKLNNTLSSLVASTYLGGGDDDFGNSLTLDESGNVYVIGGAWSTDYPTSSGAYDESHNSPGGARDTFISKLNTNLSTLLGSTFIGGIADDRGFSLTLDGSGNLFVTGRAGASDYPTTPGAYDESLDGGADVMISKLDNSLSSLLASTFLGEGSGGWSLALDGSGNVYVTGVAGPGYPTTAGAYDETFGGNTDVFVSKLDRSLLSDLGITFRSAVDTGGGFAGSSQFLNGIDYLDDPFSIVQCQNYTISIDFWLTDWQGAHVQSIDYHLTLDTNFTVDSITSENTDWNIHTETPLDPPPVDGVYHLYLESTALGGISAQDIKLHTVELSFTTVPATGWVKTELLPDGFIEDANSTQHHSIGKTEITLTTICDVNATASCTEDDPCDVIDSADICPVDANIIQNNYSWEPVDTENPLCEGDLISIYHTKTGTRQVVESCTENICTSECFNSCLTACREIEINECTVRGIGNCINGIVFPWDETTCFNYSRIVACNEECLIDCTDNCQGGNAFYNRSCGFSMDEEITLRVPDGTGECTGEVKRERTLSGDGTAWMPMTLPMEAGSYDICSYDIGSATTAFIGTVVVEACGEPTCSLSLPGGFTVNHGDTGTLEVTLENLNAGDTYALSLGWWEDDEHTIPLTDFPDSLEIDLATDEVTPGANEMVTFNIKATNAEPGLDGLTHWANIIVKADPVAYSWDCECSFNLDVISDEDGDGIPLEEDNCPDASNPLQEDIYPPGGNDIGDACECESDFTCDGDVDADDVTTFLEHFGREEYYRPCTSGDPCIGDFICDADVDADDVTIFLEDFGREEYYNPCPVCVAGDWCSY